MNVSPVNAPKTLNKIPRKGLPFRGFFIAAYSAVFCSCCIISRVVLHIFQAPHGNQIIEWEPPGVSFAGNNRKHGRYLSYYLTQNNGLSTISHPFRMNYNYIVRYFLLLYNIHLMFVNPFFQCSLYKKPAGNRQASLLHHFSLFSTSCFTSESCSFVTSLRSKRALMRPTNSGLCRWEKIVVAKYSSLVKTGRKVRP